MRSATKTAAAAGIAMQTKASSRMSRESNQSDTPSSSDPDDEQRARRAE